MKSFRNMGLMAICLLLAIFVVACGSAPTGNTGANNMDNGKMDNGKMDNGNMGATPTAGMMNDNGNMGGNMYATPTAGMNNNGDMGNGNMNNGDMNAFIHTTQVTIGGTKLTVLTNSKGMVLYHYLKDPVGQSACTGMCAKDWPPVLADNGMMNVSSSIKLPKKLSIIHTANGNQIAYDGHALYTYAGDMTPGQFTGRGMDNAWYLVGTQL